MGQKEFIIEDVDKGAVTIDGIITIEGQVMDIDDAKCHKCHSVVIYYDRYDAYFCAYCDIWLEKKCGDPSCVYCTKRPERPLEKENDRPTKYDQ